MAITSDNLIFASNIRCHKCGAGMAYKRADGSTPKVWTCMNVLLNLQAQTGHTNPIPFGYLEHVTELHPKASGQSTRPGSTVVGAMHRIHAARGTDPELELVRAGNHATDELKLKHFELAQVEDEHGVQTAIIDTSHMHEGGIVVGNEASSAPNVDPEEVARELEGQRLSQIGTPGPAVEVTGAERLEWEPLPVQIPPLPASIQEAHREILQAKVDELEAAASERASHHPEVEQAREATAETMKAAREAFDHELKVEGAAIAEELKEVHFDPHSVTPVDHLPPSVAVPAPDGMASPDGGFPKPPGGASEK